MPKAVIVKVKKFFICLVIIRSSLGPVKIELVILLSSQVTKASV